MRRNASWYIAVSKRIVFVTLSPAKPGGPESRELVWLLGQLHCGVTVPGSLLALGSHVSSRCKYVPRGIRTPGQVLRKHLLYPLSYGDW